MALRHRRLPLFGVQFHPESICSEYGARIIDNFHRITEWQLGGQQLVREIPTSVQKMSLLSLDDQVWNSGVPSSGPLQSSKSKARFTLLADVVDLGSMAQELNNDIGSKLFQHLFDNTDMPIWLDSAKHGDANSNISVMATGRSSHSATVRYTIHDRKISVMQFPESPQAAQQLDTLHLPPDSNKGGFWTWMQSVADTTTISGLPEDVQWRLGDRRMDSELMQVGFRCGWVGYFGYEMKSETVAEDPEHKDPVFVNEEDGRLPDAQLTFIDRCVVLDQRSETPRAFVLALAQDDAACTQLTTTGPEEDSAALPWMHHLAGTTEEASQWIADH
ncbi:hypothetical protein FBU59_003922, partial [Linderina macrospora]